MSNASMRNELLGLSNMTDAQMGVLVEKANDMDIPVVKLQNMDGTWPMIQLLNTKATILLALTNLEKK